jgi:hypothetical protein
MTADFVVASNVYAYVWSFPSGLSSIFFRVKSVWFKVIFVNRA